MSSFGLNVKDSVFGALGDDSNDDRSYIQAAIDFADSVGGGMVVIPRGIYRIGKHPTNDYGLHIPSKVRIFGSGWGITTLKHYGDAGAAAFPLLSIDASAQYIELENFTLDQSGLSNPLTDGCPLIDINDVEVLKLLKLQFKGGVANAGAYINVSGLANQLWIDGCELRDAGGTPLWVQGGINVGWIKRTQVYQTGEDDCVLLDGSSAINDLKIKTCHFENSQKYALRIMDAADRTRIQVESNKLLGFVKLSGMDHSHLTYNDVIASAASVSDPVLDIDTMVSCQVHVNQLHREATCDAGLVVKFDTCSRSSIQVNEWHQETAAGLLHTVDSPSHQFSGNLGRIANAGSSDKAAYLVEATTGTVDDQQFLEEHITADAGTWQYTIHVKSNTGSFGIIQIIPGNFDDVDTGVYLEGALAKFTNKIMIAGGLVDANVATWATSDSTVMVNIGANAGTFQPQWFAGNGSPEGVVTARIGSIFSRLDAPDATHAIYVKTSGTLNTGWTNK